MKLPRLLFFSIILFSSVFSTWNVQRNNYVYAAAVLPGLNSTFLSGTEIVLNWSAPTGYTGSYVISGGTTAAGAPFPPLATVTSTSYTAANLTPNTSYTFDVHTSDGSFDANTAATTAILSISNVGDTSGESGAATITWSTTAAGDSSVQYFVNGQSSAASVVSSVVQDITHSISLTGLAPCANFSYRAVSLRVSSPVHQARAGGCPGSSLVLAKQEGIVSSTGANVTITDPLRPATLHIPSNDVTGSVNFQLQQLTGETFVQNIVLPSGKHSIGSFVLMQALTDPATQIHSFNVPLGITLAYIDSDLVGYDGSSLAIQRYDLGSGWTPLSGCVTDTFAKTVSCSTTNFSTFAIFSNSTAPVVASSPILVSNSTSVVKPITTLPVTGTSIWKTVALFFTIIGAILLLKSVAK